MKKKRRDPRKGILFWVTGLSGSGKTTISKKIVKDIEKLYGPTLLISGDDIRKILISENILQKKDYHLF